MATNRDESKAAGQAPKGRTRTSRPRNTSSEPTVPARPVRRAMTLAELNDAAAAPTRKTRANVAPRTTQARTTPARRRPAANAKTEAPAAAAVVETAAVAPVAAAPVKKAPAKRGPRRATSAVTSPVASTDAPVGLIEAAPVAASAAEPVAEAPATVPAQVEEKAEAKAPAKRPTRSRSRRASAPAGDAAGTPVKEAAVAAPVAEAPVAEEAVVEAAVVDAPVVEAAEEVVVVAEAPAEEAVEAPAEAPAKTARKRPTRSSRSAKAPASRRGCCREPRPRPRASSRPSPRRPWPPPEPNPPASPIRSRSRKWRSPCCSRLRTCPPSHPLPQTRTKTRMLLATAATAVRVPAPAPRAKPPRASRPTRTRPMATPSFRAVAVAAAAARPTLNLPVASRTIRRTRSPACAHRAPSLDSVMSNKVTAVKGSTRLEAKRQRRRDSRESGRRRQVITEAEFLARRESVDRQMIVRQREDRIQIGVLEDGILAEHFVSKTQQDSLIGNVYIGKVQNVLPSMEAAFVDIGRGRNAVLYAGEVNWDVAGLDGQPRRIEHALKSGDTVLVQVTKDPVGHKGARLTSQISLPGRYLVYVPGGSMTGISRKLPDVERNRLKKILKDHLPENAGVIVRTAAEGASEEELMNDINRLRAQWEGIEAASTSTKTLAPELLYGEPDLTIKVVRDVFNEDFTKLIVSGNEAWDTIEAYVTYVAPDLISRLEKWESNEDIFGSFRIDEQIHKALDRKVFLPSGGSLVIDRTEAMTVVDVNTGKFTGSGGNLEETVTKNNLEAAEEVVRQLRLRDIGGIIVIDFIDMVLESNRDLVLRRLVECLGRDRTKHQVAEVTSLGLVQMTRKRMGTGLLEVFGENCEACNGRGVITHDEPVEHRRAFNSAGEPHAAVEPRPGEAFAGRTPPPQPCIG